MRLSADEHDLTGVSVAPEILDAAQPREAGTHDDDSWIAGITHAAAPSSIRLADRTVGTRRTIMTRQLEIKVDRTLCVSNQMCLQAAPGVFVAGEGGQSHVADPSAASEDGILDAAFNCPVSAISVHDAATGEDLLD
jgi:ferredoxin